MSKATKHEKHCSNKLCILEGSGRLKNKISYWKFVHFVNCKRYWDGFHLSFVSKHNTANLDLFATLSQCTLESSKSPHYLTL